MKKINFRIKIEIYIFTKQGVKNIIDTKILENSTNGLIGFLAKYIK